jgi:hypothetical protein
MRTLFFNTFFLLITYFSFGQYSYPFTSSYGSPVTFESNSSFDPQVVYNHDSGFIYDVSRNSQLGTISFINDDYAKILGYIPESNWAGVNHPIRIVFIGWSENIIYQSGFTNPKIYITDENYNLVKTLELEIQTYNGFYINMSGKTYFDADTSNNGIYKFTYSIVFNDGTSLNKTKSNFYNEYLKFSEESTLSSVTRKLKTSKVFPNPVRNKLNIKSNFDNNDLQVLDSTGKLIMNEKGNKIDMSELPTGSYILKVISKENNTDSHLIIKE